MTVIDDLRERFPAAFTAPPQPLARRVHEAISARAPDLALDDVCEALAVYTAAPDYLRACAPGAVRIDLDGHLKGWVTAKEALDAAYRLENEGMHARHNYLRARVRAMKREAREIAQEPSLSLDAAALASSERRERGNLTPGPAPAAPKKGAGLADLKAAAAARRAGG